MRKIFVLEFMTLDGVIQGPGGPQEDVTPDFKYSGWMGQFFEGDAIADQEMQEELEKTEALLLGRKTYDIWVNFWPEHGDQWPAVNSVTKYVVSSTLQNPTWDKTEVIHDIDELKKLKYSEGPDLQVFGSANLVQTLMEHDMIDEFWLKIFPVTLGSGKKLFNDGTKPYSFELISSKVTQNGIVIAKYKRAGEVKTSSVA